MIDLNATVSGIFGMAVIASGVMRYVERPDGEKGLWFGLVMGGLAIVASLLFHRCRNLVARILTWFCLVVVGGWFVYEALVVKGFAAAEPRMLIMVALTIGTGIFFLTRFNQNAKAY